MFIILWDVKDVKDVRRVHNPVGRKRRKRRKSFEVERENDCFIVISSRCRQNLKFGDLTLLFCGVRQRNAREFVVHVQHVYFSFFNQ